MKREKQLESIIAILFGLFILPKVFNVDVEVIKYLRLSSFILICIALFSKKLTYWISFGWNKFSEGIGAVMSKLILSLVFFVVLFPISILYRFFAKDNLNLKRRKKISFFIERNHVFSKRDLENQW